MLDSTSGMSRQWKVDDINFEEIDEDLASFQEDEIVQSALHRGVDLRKYGKELERDLRQVRKDREEALIISSSDV